MEESRRGSKLTFQYTGRLLKIRTCNCIFGADIASKFVDTERRVVEIFASKILCGVPGYFSFFWDLVHVVFS